MVYKGNADEDEDNDASLLSLLKRLPKDFSDRASIDYFDDEEEDENGGDFSIMIIKPDKNQTMRRLHDFKWASFDDDRDDYVFLTFMVRLSGERAKLNLKIRLQNLHCFVSLPFAVQLGDQLVKPLR
ncbi:hypothetical protein FF1_022830 [Malus domestica]